MLKLLEKSTTDSLDDLDCDLIMRLIERMRAVSVGDVKMAQAIDALDQDSRLDELTLTLHPSVFSDPFRSQAA